MQLDGGDGHGGGVMQRLMGRMQGWMLGVIRRHGFLGILLLASWPNAAFDLCGICCGHFQMPFWQFFGATLIGKALVKVPMHRPGPCSSFCYNNLRLQSVPRLSSRKPTAWPSP